MVTTTHPIFLDVFLESGTRAHSMLGSVSGSFLLYNTKAMEWLREKELKFASQVNATTMNRLRAELEAGYSAGETYAQLTERVQVAFSGTERAEGWRAQRIARTECLVGNTLIETDKGLTRIRDFRGGRVWDGTKFVEAKLIEQGTRKVADVSLNNGKTITATLDHRLLINIGS